MGSISKNGAGWRAQVARHGVRKSRTFDSKRQALDWAAEEEAKILATIERPASVYTVADMLQRYLAEVTPKKASSKHETDRINALLRDYPDLANTLLEDVSATDLANWRDSRLRSVSPSSVVRMVNTLRNAFRLAREEWGWMTNNPITGFRIPKHAPPRDKIMSWREIRGMCRALGYLPGYKPATKQQEVAYALLVALRTGMRAGEVLQINQENVDLDKRVIRIRNHKTRKVTGKDRIVPISTKAARLIKTVGSFTIPSASLDSLFRKARANAGLEGFTFHDSRATALTWLSKQVDAITLARISGHRNLSILLNTYYRESPEDIAKRLA